MEIIVLTGIQASGKSTFYKDFFFKSHIHISLDMLRTRRKEDIMIEACIKAKQSFVIDNTNVTPEERKKYIALAKKYGFSIISYFFQVSAGDARKLNEKREGKERIPSSIIAVTNNKLIPPDYNEGFSEIYHVTIGETGQFVIQKQKRTF